MTDNNNEDSIAQYFVTGLVATLVSNPQINWLTVFVLTKKLIDVEIDKALDRWAEELEAEDFEDMSNNEDGVDDE